MLLRLVKQECAQGLQRELAGILTVSWPPIPSETSRQKLSLPMTSFSMFKEPSLMRYIPAQAMCSIVVTNLSDIRNAADLQSHRLFNRKFQCGYLKLLALTQGVPFVFLQSHPVYGRAVGRPQVTDLPLAVL